MADFPYANAGKFTTYGAVTASSVGTTITAHASNHTKGSYTEFSASTDHQAHGIYVCLGSVAITGRFLVDVAIGAAGSEVDIIPNLLIRGESSSGPNHHMYFPISIPAGTRLSMRCQSTAGGSTIRAVLIIVGGGFANQTSYSKVVAIGITTGGTDGTSYQTSGVANNVDSPWQVLTASTSYPIKAIKFVVSCFVSVDFNTLIDFAIGGAGSETAVISDMFVAQDTVIDGLSFSTDWLPISIPSGTRLTFRERCSAVNAGNFVVVAVYALC